MAYELFHNQVQSALNCFCPVTKISIKNREWKKGWLSNRLKNACRKKNELYKKFIINPIKENEEKYKMFKNKLRKSINAEKALNIRKNF
jgi:transposase